MKETTQKLGSAVSFTSIIEPKFKTSSVMLMMLLPVQPEKNAAYALALGLLTDSCRKYPNVTAMTRKLDSMYGAALNCSVNITGDVMQLVISGSVIADRYALRQETLSQELIGLMLDCLLDPNVKDGGFDPVQFRIQKAELLDTIEAEINNKRYYAVMRARETAFRGEPYAYPCYGTKADVEALTPQSVYAAYQEMLRLAAYRIYYVAPEETNTARLREALSGLGTAQELHFCAPSPAKPQPEHATETMPVNQSKLVLVFKGGTGSREAMRLFSAIFGGTPFSMLFANVREKMSLCYYCMSSSLFGKGAVIVESGVELSNAQRAHEAVLAQLDAVRRGEFSDEMLDNAKRSIINELRRTGDTPRSCIADAHDRFAYQDEASVDERAARYAALTRQEVIDAANALHEDTVYLMAQEEQEVPDEQND